MASSLGTRHCTYTPRPNFGGFYKLASISPRRQLQMVMLEEQHPGKESWRNPQNKPSLRGACCRAGTLLCCWD